MNNDSLISSMYLDPEINIGVYVIQIQGQNNPINVSILDPYENEISKSTNYGDSNEERFSINKKGIYKMKITNTSGKVTQINYALGYMPN